MGSTGLDDFEMQHTLGSVAVERQAGSLKEAAKNLLSSSINSGSSSMEKP